MASQGLGILVGAGAVAGLTAALSQAALESWGWRVPFFVGMLIAPVGLYIRRHLEETLDPRSVPAGTPPRGNSIVEVCRDHRATLVAAVLSMAGGTAAAQIGTVYMATYAIRELGLPPAVALSGAALMGVTSFLLAPFVGLWSDRVGRKPLIVWARLGMVVLVYPGFLWLNMAPTPAVLFTVIGALGVLSVIQGAPGITMMPEMFPKHLRVGGMSLVYGLGVALFGGFSPFVVTWLVEASGNRMAPAWYLLGITIVSMWGLFRLKDYTGLDIDAAGAHRPAGQAVPDIDATGANATARQP